MQEEAQKARSDITTSHKNIQTLNARAVGGSALCTYSPAPVPAFAPGKPEEEGAADLKSNNA